MLAKLRHPTVLRVIEPLEETGRAFLFVTERVVCHVASYIGGFQGLPNAAEIRESTSPSELEVKHGMIQVWILVHIIINNIIMYIRNQGSINLCLSDRSFDLGCSRSRKQDVFGGTRYGFHQVSCARGVVHLCRCTARAQINLKSYVCCTIIRQSEYAYLLGG